MSHRISIIIRCKDEEAAIGRVLEMVYSQDAGEPFEVVVIDSGSTDRTLEIVSGFDCVLVEIPPESFSYGYAMNLGARKASGEILVYLSAHCPPVSNLWLKKLVEPFSDEKVAGTFGAQVPEAGVNPFEEWRLARAFPRERCGLQQFMFSSANAAVRRSIWERLPFDEKLPFSEDRAWARQAAGRGLEVCYVPDSKVYHSHPFSLSGINRRAYSAGWAKKMIYGSACRFDSAAWIAGAFVYCVIRDLAHFAAHGYWRFIWHIPRYRYLELSGFRRGALEQLKSLSG